MLQQIRHKSHITHNCQIQYPPSCYIYTRWRNTLPNKQQSRELRNVFMCVCTKALPYPKKLNIYTIRILGEPK